MKYEAYVVVRRIYTKKIEAASMDEARKITEDAYGYNVLHDYEDELMDIDVFEEENGE